MVNVKNIIINLFIFLWVLFTFTNTGEGTLIISDIKVSCGCTVIVDFAKEIKPGESSYIGGNFNSNGYSGEVKRTVTFKTNDPKNSQVELIIKAVIFK